MSKFKDKIRNALRNFLNIPTVKIETVEDYRKRGVQIGEGTRIYGANIDGGHGRLISIGKNCNISQATILAHDGSTYAQFGYTRVGKVKIGDEVFIGIHAIILPGVTIGDRVIIGAGAVVSRDIPSNSLVVGNPAKVVGEYDAYIEKHRKLIEELPRFETYHTKKTEEDWAEMNKLLDKTMGYDK